MAKDVQGVTRQTILRNYAGAKAQTPRDDKRQGAAYEAC